MKKILQSTTILMAAACALAPAAAYALDNPIRGNIRVVIGSKSTGGDTYQASSIIAEALAQKIDANIKVDAVGFSAAYQALGRVPTGNTLMIFHDQAYLGNLYGQKGYEDPFKEWTIGPSFATNPGNGYLVPKNSPYKNMDEILNAAGNGKTIRVAIQPGGVSEIGYTAMKNAVRLAYPGQEDNLVALNTGSQSDKNQALFDGLADVINGSVQANEQYTRLPADDQKAMNFVWLTAKASTIAKANPNGMGETSRDQLMQYASGLGVNIPMDAENNFTFDKEFYFLYNKRMSPEVIEFLDKALAEVFADGKVQETFKKSFFIPNFRTSAEAQKHFKEKRDSYAKIINNLHK
ncbi:MULTISPECIES: ABC transporter substrate-binding protein [Marinomonas]|uniref:Tripartite-type tricarboxylate transporter receptor subunit TctC n=1 Tax=Marinomonas alcarazii TaxID=491949 RepID=A0A318V3M8_9GAMM|nr:MULTISPECIES: ABC transporter substrate-binding protein [Marinomonas]PYF82351.1 tripartite-type tricarboxylate transporter receptor subunit TctC [Marinomonas alcarazii]